jgi:DeoR family transcriptional regulator, glycerol-3-phosphate regulon repressor
MRPLHPRQADILDIARIEGRVDVESLSVRFNVTPQTIRKDLNDLCDIHALERVHGGAVIPNATSNVSYGSRRELAIGGKSRIAALAANQIPNNSSLILNLGTTTEQVALALRYHTGLLVITNSLHVAAILTEVDHIDLVVVGGVVRKSDGGIIGASAVEMIQQFKVDFAIIGSSAIDGEGSLLDFDYREVQVAKTILKQARTKILVADAMKFQRRAPVQIGELSEIDVFVTDLEPPREIVQMCRESDVELIIAGQSRG